MLAEGDRLAFVLRANATMDRRSGRHEDVVSGTRRRPCKDRRVDVVMHAMRERGIKGGTVGPESRAARRMDVAGEAAKTWIAAQGRRRGFSVEEPLEIEDYRVAKVKRRSGREATFGVLDLRGRLTVRSPEVFVDALLGGFGRAKAYGCGLMLIRRA